MGRARDPETDPYGRRDPAQPVEADGPYNRVSDNKLAKQLLGREPGVDFSECLDRTIKWYYATHDRKDVARDFERNLTEH